MTTIRIALAAALFAATSSVAFAQGFDPNMANRYPAYTQSDTYGYSAGGKLGNMNSAPAATLQSAPVSLQKRGNVGLQTRPVLQQRDVALPTDSRFATGPLWYNGSGPTTGGM